MFEHLDDPWSFDEPLADVDTVRRRGRGLQIRRQFATLGTTFVIFVSLLGAASFASGGSNPEHAVLAEPGDFGGTTSTSIATTSTVATPETVPAEGSATTVPESAPSQPGSRPGGSPSTPSQPSPPPTTPAPGSGTAPSNPGAGPVTPPPGGGSATPVDVVLAAAKDSYLAGENNTNMGTARSVHVHNAVPAILGFDVHSIDRSKVTKATLRVTVCASTVACAEGPNGWPGATGGTISAFRLHDGWERWAQGNSVSGTGVTWNCAIDLNIGNAARECDGDTSSWNGGNALNGAERPGPAITNSLTDGVTIEFDVTADVQAGLGADGTYMTFFLRKTSSGGGNIDFYSAEGANAAGNTALAPQLIVKQSS